MRYGIKMKTESIWQLCLFVSFLFVCLFLDITVAYAQDKTLNLRWAANDEPDLEGYKVYYGTSSRNYTANVDVGNTTEYTLTGLSEGTTYYFAATAYDTLNNESDYSTEIVYTINFITHTITASAGSNGNISPSGTITVNEGDNQSFSITPDQNYHVDDVLVDGSSVGAVTSYTFVNVTGNHSVTGIPAVCSH